MDESDSVVLYVYRIFYGFDCLIGVVIFIKDIVIYLRSRVVVILSCYMLGEFCSGSVCVIVYVVSDLNLVGIVG